MQVEVGGSDHASAFADSRGGSRLGLLAAGAAALGQEPFDQQGVAPDVSTGSGLQS